MARIGSMTLAESIEYAEARAIEYAAREDWTLARAMIAASESARIRLIQAGRTPSERIRIARAETASSINANIARAKMSGSQGWYAWLASGISILLPHRAGARVRAIRRGSR